VPSRIGARRQAAAAKPAGASLVTYAFSNSEAAAYVARMTAPPNDVRCAVIDAFVGGLKADGLWAKFEWLHLFAAHNEQAALLDLKNVINASKSGLPTFAADRGFTGDGVSTRIALTWNIALATIMSQNSVAFHNWSRTAAVGSDNDILGPGCRIVDRAAGDLASTRINSSANVSTAASSVTDGSGLFTVSRQSGTEYSVYRNGVALAGSPLARASTTPSGSSWQSGMTRQFSFWGASSGLSAAEALAFYNRLQAYMTAVGA
jgi:hypothetical protein